MRNLDPDLSLIATWVCPSKAAARVSKPEEELERSQFFAPPRWGSSREWQRDNSGFHSYR